MTACVLFITSCSIHKVVPDGEALLVENNIEPSSNKVSKSTLEQQVLHEPNKEGLFRRYRFKRYLKTRNLEEDKQKGVKPVYLDSARVEQSAMNIRNYLFNAGYYDASVDYTVAFKGDEGKKAEVTYNVYIGPPYIVSEILYHSAQDDILTHVKNALDTNSIHPGVRIEHEKLKKARDGITAYIRNEGYYGFNRSYIDFQIDSSQVNKTVKLRINVKSPEVGYHQIYTVKKVHVRILHEHEDSGQIEKFDRIYYEIGEYKLKPNILSKNIRIKPYSEYKQSLVDLTYSRLINLGLFRLVNIRFVPENDSSTVLTAIITCEPNSKYSVIWEPQVLTSDQRISGQTSTNNVGVANVVTFKNRNIFLNGEEFDLRSRTAYETQLSQDTVSVVSTISQEVNAELRFPRLLLLDNLNDPNKGSGRFSIPRTLKSQTSMNISFVYERNPFYLRRVLPFDITYEFVYDSSAIYWKPVVISLNQAKVATGFLGTVSPNLLSYYERLFTNNLITSTRLIATYSNRKRVFRNDGFEPGRYWEVISNALELAGMYLPTLTDQGEVFNVQHSTFVRSDVDVRFNRVYNLTTSWVIRAYAGVGVPFRGTILPYDRRYYVGGASSLRGWRPRTVGPGSYSTTSTLQFDRSGEILVQANAEYRFDIYKGPFDVELAPFVDAGNVWTFDNETYPGGQFTVHSLIHDMAINTGMGFRLDFTYFLIRFDYGIPVKDPNLVPEDRWVILDIIENKGNLKRNVWSVAINHPF